MQDWCPAGDPWRGCLGLSDGDVRWRFLLGADDVSGDLAELYGYVNRSLPDAEAG